MVEDVFNIVGPGLPEGNTFLDFALFAFLISAAIVIVLGLLIWCIYSICARCRRPIPITRSMIENADLTPSQIYDAGLVPPSLAFLRNSEVSMSTAETTATTIGADRSVKYGSDKNKKSGYDQYKLAEKKKSIESIISLNPMFAKKELSRTPSRTTQLSYMMSPVDKTPAKK